MINNIFLIFYPFIFLYQRVFGLELQVMKKARLKSLTVNDIFKKSENDKKQFVDDILRKTSQYSHVRIAREGENRRFYDMKLLKWILNTHRRKIVFILLMIQLRLVVGILKTFCFSRSIVYCTKIRFGGGGGDVLEDDNDDFVTFRKSLYWFLIYGLISLCHETASNALWQLRVFFKLELTQCIRNLIFMKSVSINYKIYHKVESELFHNYWFIVHGVSAIVSSVSMTSSLVMTFATILYFVLTNSNIVVSLVIPILFVLFFPLFYYCQKKLIQSTDTMKQVFREQRKLVNQCIELIKFIKILNLEQFFRRKFKFYRTKSISLLKVHKFFQVLFQVMGKLNPYITCAIIFGYFYFYERDAIDFTRIYVVFDLIHSLSGPMKDYPGNISKISQLFKSIRMIEKFLNIEEITNDPKVCKELEEVNLSIRIKDSSFSYHENTLSSSFKNSKIKEKEEQFRLKDISLNVKKNELLMVIGEIGQGKTTLLRSIMGELKTIKGEVEVETNRFCYYPQNYWIETKKSIRENICRFGEAETMNDKGDAHYRRIVDICCLQRDFDELGVDDSRILNDQMNVNLSIGQCSRVNLARSLFSVENTANYIFLFDDIFSNVDIETGMELFEKVFIKYLKDSTRILVTHHLRYLKYADRIVIMDKGRIEDIGTLEELSNSRFLKNLRLKSEKKNEFIGEGSNLSKIEEKKKVEEGDTPKEPKKKTEMKAEKYHFFRTVLKFYSRNSYIVFGLFILFGVLCTVSKELEKYYLVIFSGRSKRLQKEVIEMNEMYFVYFLLYGASRIICFAIFYGLRHIYFIELFRIYHEDLTVHILESEISRYDTLNYSKIGEHFNRNIPRVRNYQGRAISSQIMNMTSIVSSLSIILYTSRFLIFVLIPFSVLYYILDNFFRVAKLQTIDLIRQSMIPINSHRRNCVMGSELIRNFRKKNLVQREDIENVSCMVDIEQTKRVLCRWYDHARSLLLSTFLIVMFVSAMYFKENGLFSIDGENAILMSLLITQSRSFISKIHRILFNYGKMKRSFRSVERIENVISSITRENLVEDENSFKIKGNVEFRDIFMKYGGNGENSSLNGNMVLKGVNFKIKKGEKIAFIGKTGEGKSTAIQLLLNLRKRTSGNIFVEGRNIDSIPLKTLRKQMSFISQEPIVFPFFTIRENLDPFNHNKDEEILELLKLFNLNEKVGTLEVNMGDVNLSVGEKQLICFIRSLLKDKKRNSGVNLFILDEPNSNIDHVTDEMITGYILNEMKEKTVLIVTHRLNVLESCHKILKIERGKIRNVDLKDIN